MARLRHRPRGQRSAVEQLAEVAVDGRPEMNPIRLLARRAAAGGADRLGVRRSLARMRAERLTFGDRVHCPFMRPLFLTDDDERRVREFAETWPCLASAWWRRRWPSRRCSTSWDPPRRAAADRHRAGLPAGEHLVARRHVPAARLAPGREYNAESPAGSGTRSGWPRLRAASGHERFKASFEVEAYALSEPMLDALMASYREWAAPPSRRPSASSTGGTCRPGASSRSCRSASRRWACPPSSVPPGTSSSTGVR